MPLFEAYWGGMNQIVTTDEYAIIESELESSDDYRAFILKYFEIKNQKVQYLLIKANWLLLAQEQNQSNYLAGLRQFVRKHQSHADDRVKAMVIDVWFKRFKLEMSHLNYFEINEALNNLAEYAHNIVGEYKEVYKVLVYVYWFKGQHTLDKDWRKAQYFYNKVISLSREINDEEHNLYIIKAKISKVVLHIQYGHSERIEQLFYKYLEDYVKHPNSSVHLQLKQLIQLYIDHLVLEHQWFTLHDNAKRVLDYIETHLELQNIILTVDDVGTDPEILLLLAQQYWLQDKVIYEDFLYKYFEDVADKAHLIEMIDDYLVFDAHKVYKNFILVIDELYERYINLNKYRKLFSRKIAQSD